ncbi:hypothetical protein HHK36_002309 [Tetracentron sinense]|uniref:J domain-containing protein n=1 Tax=Tetracentron sinense TaxID=13715 RepID=A0A835A5A1_TETSI|nr:hypothetical protein HHK36_002309 [Tetracentron sinense]
MFGTLTFPTAASSPQFIYRSYRKMISSSRSPSKITIQALSQTASRVYARKPANLYEVLRIKETASQIEIKTAYRSLAKLFHPDATASDSDGRDFMDIHSAYATLSDATARARYDLSIGTERLHSYSAGNRPGFGRTRREKGESFTPQHGVDDMQDKRMLDASAAVCYGDGPVFDRPVRRWAARAQGLGQQLRLSSTSVSGVSPWPLLISQANTAEEGPAEHLGLEGEELSTKSLVNQPDMVLSHQPRPSLNVTPSLQLAQGFDFSVRMVSRTKYTSAADTCQDLTFAQSRLADQMATGTASVSERILHRQRTCLHHHIIG